MRKNNVTIKCKDCNCDFVVPAWKSKGHTTRCDNCKKERHGLTNTRLYTIWENIKQRTSNPNHDSYFMYGGNGIVMCKEWSDSFMCFYDWSISNGYSDYFTIDRIDGAKGYYPSNCRWTTQIVQARNLKQVSKSNSSGYKGVHYRKDRNKYQSAITVGYKKISLGYYNTAKDAAIAYNEYISRNNLEHTQNEV